MIQLKFCIFKIFELKVKLEVYPLIKVPSRNQEWHGWPDYTTDNVRYLLHNI